MQSLVKIRVAKPEDASQINEVLYQTWLATYPNQEVKITKEDIEERFKDRQSEEKLEKRRNEITNDTIATLLVAVKNGKIVGLCRIERLPDKNRLRTIYVLPEYQSKGIGTMMWEEIQKYTDAKKDITVEVATYNKKAIAFYEKLGFQDTGKRFKDERFYMKSKNTIPEIEMILKVSNE